MAKAQVFMTGEISPEAMLSMYRKLGVTLNGKVAVKLHSGEPGNKNFIRPAFMRPVIEAVNGTVAECNSAYGGPRSTSASHWKALKEHGWTENFKVDLLDEDGDVVLPVKNGLRLKENYVGSHLERYDSMLVLSHFKGHEMGGFGGALKNIAIGIASSRGKEIIHTSNDPGSEWKADLAFFREHGRRLPDDPLAL